MNGAFYAVAAAVLFGVSTPLARLLLGRIDPVLLAGLLYLGSGFGLWVWSMLRQRDIEAPLRRADVPWLMGSVVCGGILGPLLLMLGLARASAGAVSLTLNLEGVFTTLLAWFAFHEAFDRRIALGMGFILSGGLLLSWSGEADVSWGLVLVALACLAWALDNNLTRRIAAADPLQIAMIKGFAAGTVNTAIALLVLHAAVPPAVPVGLAALLGFACYGASLRFFVLGLRHIGTARTGAYFSMAPFVGAALAIPLLGERPSLQTWAAAGLMAIGVGLHLTERHEHAHTHAPIEHEHVHTHDDDHHTHDHPHDEAGPHAHVHTHEMTRHAHPHFPDIHHGHDHEH